MGGFTSGSSSNNNSAGDNYQKSIEKIYGSTKKSTSNRETYRTSKSYQSSVSGSKGRKAKEEARKAVSKSKLDNYELPKSDAPGMLGMALNATQKQRQKSFEKNRDYFQKNVAGKRGFEDTFEDYERYITGRGQGNLDAMGREINSGGGGGIETANQVGSLAKDTQQTAVDDAPDGPTSVEMTSTETEAERLVKNKKKGRRSTILNKPEGLDEDVDLGKKYLLG